jgi:hypothetical protein
MTAGICRFENKPGELRAAAENLKAGRFGKMQQNGVQLEMQWGTMKCTATGCGLNRKFGNDGFFYCTKVIDEGIIK